MLRRGCFHQSRARHRADAARYGRYERRLRLDLVKAHVAEEFAGLGVTVHGDVDNDCAVFNHVAANKPRRACRDDENIRLPRKRRKIPSVPVAVCHGCVGVEQHKPHRAADDVAASDYDAVFAVGRNAVFVQHIHYSGRGARHKRTLARDHAADVYRVEGVHVLFRRDRVYHRALGYLLRQRKLHEDAVNAVVGVERRDKPQKLCLRRCGREVISAAVYAALEAVALFIAHIYLRCRVVSYQHRRKAGPAAHRRRLAFHLLAELLRELFPSIKLPYF